MLERKSQMKVKTLLETKFIKVFDLQYKEDSHYYNATRRNEKDLVAAKSTEEFKNMLPDAVSCVVIWNPVTDESNDGDASDGKNRPQLLMNREFRYPTGQYLLSVPAGLIDPEDSLDPAPLIKTAERELKEETGIDLTETDEISVINPCLFSTPGMTDESNALVKIVLNRKSLTGMTQDGALGGELFDGFDLLTKDQAKKILKDGVDEHGIYYSVYTWAALTYFVTDLWR